MEQKSSLVRGFLALGALAIVAAVGVYLLIQWLGVLDPNVAAAIIAGSVAAGGAIYSQWRSHLRQIEEAHRDRKIEVYNIYLDIIDELISNRDDLGKISEGEIPEDIQKLFAKLRRGLLTWASPGVIKAYEDFRGGSQSQDPTDILFRSDRVFRAIRKDLRNSNFGLQEGDLVRLFLQNPQELPPKKD